MNVFVENIGKSGGRSAPKFMSRYKEHVHGQLCRDTFVSSKYVSKKLPSLFCNEAANCGGIASDVKIMVGDPVRVKYSKKKAQLFAVKCV